MLESKSVAAGQSDDIVTDQDDEAPTFGDRVKSVSERIGTMWNNEPDK
jgi:hypothetical protein